MGSRMDWNRDMEKILEETKRDDLTSDHPIIMQTMQPTFVLVNEELLRKVHELCQTGLENAQECLSAHDASLGRTTRKNIELAEMYEKDIREAKSALAEVRAALGWSA